MMKTRKHNTLLMFKEYTVHWTLNLALNPHSSPLETYKEGERSDDGEQVFGRSEQGEKSSFQSS